MPPWYTALDQWLLSYGWAALLGLASVLAAVTLWLIVTKQAVPLALWLTYLVMP